MFAIQSEFNEIFPYLKIEIISMISQSKEFSLKDTFLYSRKTIEESSTIHNNGEIIVTSEMTVAELIRLFRETYGLTAKIYRKSGKAWLETSVTDDWTLKDQNQQGKDLSK